MTSRPEGRVDVTERTTAAGPSPSPFGSGLQCRAITAAAGFLHLESAWRELFEAVDRPTPFQSWDFAVEWWRHFVVGRAGGATGQFEAIVARDSDSRVIAIVPLYAERSPGEPKLGTRLQPFGKSYTFEAMTDEPIALFRRGHERAAVAAIKAYLAANAAHRGWDVAVVRDACRDVEPSRRHADRHCVEISRPLETPLSVALPRSWELFRNRLSKSMRDNLAYYPRRLSREIRGWRIRAAQSPADVALATAALVLLHRQRSQSTVGKQHCSHIPTDTHAAFITAWFQRMSRRNQLSLMILETSEGIRAVQAFVEGPACMSVYYSGFHDDMFRYSALTLITAEMIRTSIARGLSRMDFPPGSAVWTARWGASPGDPAKESSLYAVTAQAVARGVARRWRLVTRVAVGWAA